MGVIVNPLLKKSVNVFECMETAECIYEGAVEPSYKKPTREYANLAGLISKMRVEATSETTYSDMSESSVKHRKFYVDHPRDISKLTFLIHGPVHS